MVESARLESVFTLTGNEGSNPSLSAIEETATDFHGGMKEFESLRGRKAGLSRTRLVGMTCIPTRSRPSLSAISGLAS